MSLFEDIKEGLNQAIDFETSQNKKKKLMAGLQVHWEKALELYPRDRIVGLFLQGSQNYNLDDEESDIDSKLLIVPSFEDIVWNRNPVSTTIVLPNDEHMDVKDIRLYMQTVRKGNLNFVEIFFTEVRILNPDYEPFWRDFDLIREDIAWLNPRATIKAMTGMAAEKRHALTHRYPSRAAIIDKMGGYDPKQLHHLLRIRDFIQDISTSLVTEKYDYNSIVHRARYSQKENEALTKIKREGVGSVDKATEIAAITYYWIQNMADYLLEEFTIGENDETLAHMLEITGNIIKTGLKMELGSENDSNT